MSWKKALTKGLIRFCYRALNQEVAAIAYQLAGVDMGTNSLASGEDYAFSEVVIPNLRSKIVFDVGTNKGDYTHMIISKIPDAKIEMFEPNPECYASLEEILNCTLHRIALTDHDGNMTFYAPVDSYRSSHGSLVRHYENKDDAQFQKSLVPTSRLDTLISQGVLTVPEFLKIDTEGQDLKVLIGAGQYLNEISWIQFEFNDMHIHSRIFLKDYYDLLTGFDIYRIGPNKLIDIRVYSPNYEIFRFQNLLCMNKSLGLDLSKFF